MNANSLPMPSQAAAGTKSNSETKSVAEIIKERQSHELVIGICGAIGSNTRSLNDELKTLLSSVGYTVEEIKVSDLLPKGTAEDTKSAYSRYAYLQKTGNEIRAKKAPDRLAQEAIREIVKRRKRHEDPAATGTDKHKLTKKNCLCG